LKGSENLGRTTVYNNITTPEKLAQVNPENIQLGNDFLEYLTSIDRAKTTISSYKSDLDIIWVIVLDLLNNKFFVDLTKRDIVKIQNYCLNELHWSPARMRRVKSTMSSLSNYVETMLDDEFEGYRPIVRKIENPAACPVREKTILTEEQLQKLLDHLVDKGQYDKACMLSMAMNNGRRKAELPRMKVSYFTEDNVIYGSLYRTPETVTTKGRGSRGKQLTIYTLKNGFQKYLDLWMKYREENNIMSEWLIPKKENGVYVDEQIPITTMDSWAESFSNFLGISFYWHSLRHLFATKLSEANIPDSVIQDIIGWESADMCRIYIDTSADKKFEKYFGEEGIKTVEQKSLSDI
jgi:integrase